jgi:hypothetical protein
MKRISKADLFLHSNEVDFMQELLKKSEQKLALSFIFMFRYIDVPITD